MISARQLANSHLARVASDIIALRQMGQDAVDNGIIGNACRYKDVAAGYAYDAAITARSMWADMYSHKETDTVL